MSMDGRSHYFLRDLRNNVDRASFAGECIKNIANSVKHTNIFDNQQVSDLVTDEALRKYRMAEDIFKRGREKKVSIAVPDTTSESHKEIIRRQTGFVRPEDLTRMRQFERPEDHNDEEIGDSDLDDYLPYTRQVSIQPPSVTAHKIRSGLARYDRKEKKEAIAGTLLEDEMEQEIEKRSSFDYYAPKADTSATVPKTLQFEPQQRKARESHGGVVWKSGSDFRMTRLSDFGDGKRESYAADGKRKMSVLTRLIDDVATTQGPGPTLKDYIPFSEQQQKKPFFLLTFSPEKYINLNAQNDPRELYLRHRQPMQMRPQDQQKSIDHILGLQHGKRVYRKISTDYVRTIDQIEQREETSLRGLDYAKQRPAISVKEYRKQNQEYNERLARLSKLAKEEKKKQEAGTEEKVD